MKDLKLLIEILDMAGTILIAYMAIRVHVVVQKEHKIDNRVFKAMKREQYLGILGIFFILAAFVLKIVSGIY